MKLKFMELIKNFLQSGKSPVNTLESKGTEGAAKKLLGKPSKSRVSSEFIDKKKQSLKDSQGVSDFSGSGYNGPGNVDREKTNSNMSQRNL
ncbi:MAG TPA: hypothetical protein VNJ01_00510 [Bacteriovoracaceae bacterium]|nr:hypothetical protein [Bacteriovoracaceae bacterium]